MKRVNKTNLNIVKVSGGNSVNFINNCVSEGLNLNNINRTSSKELTFEISDNDYSKLSTIDNRGCNISTVEFGGKKKFINAFIYRIGLVVGIIVSLVGIMLFNNRLIQIHVLGLTRTSKDDVIRQLEELGVTKFSYMNYDTNKLEKGLSNEFRFSLVSIIKKGNSLIVNIKEELPDLENSYTPITADYNMVINSIKVYAGTSKVKEGMLVYKGDILVEPFIKKGDGIVYVSPIAEIDASVFLSNSYVFKNNEEIFVRTGKKEIVNSEIKLGKYRLNKSEKNSSYSHYEKEENITLVSNYFLPISINKTYAYELEKKCITRNFENEKEAIINRQKELLYLTCPKSLEINNEEVKITPINDGYIINVYLMSLVSLKYE